MVYDLSGERMRMAEPVKRSRWESERTKDRQSRRDKERQTKLVKSPERKKERQRGGREVCGLAGGRRKKENSRENSAWKQERSRRARGVRGCSSRGFMVSRCGE